MLRISSSIIGLTLLLSACGAPAMDDHSMHTEEGGSMLSTEERLNNSPRHQEWVEVKNGDKTIYTWVVYPQVASSSPVVLLIHENRGLNDWARSMADQLAEEGYIAVAPDLLSGFDATHQRTSDFQTQDDAIKAISQLKPDDVMSDLKAVAAWAKTIPASDGKMVSAGFCWGGSQSFRFATVSQDLNAALVFYGTGPTDAADYASVSAPVFGFYGGADQRVNATIDASAEAMADAGKTYDYKIYDGAGHAFMRLGEDQSGDPKNIAARHEAFERLKRILSGL